MAFVRNYQIIVYKIFFINDDHAKTISGEPRHFQSFTEIIISYFTKLPMEYQLFGIPESESVNSYSTGLEFGNFLRMMKLGMFFNIHWRIKYFCHNPSLY